MDVEPLCLQIYREIPSFLLSNSGRSILEPPRYEARTLRSEYRVCVEYILDTKTCTTLIRIGHTEVVLDVENLKIYVLEP